jgi:hypothetical protein
MIMEPTADFDRRRKKANILVDPPQEKSWRRFRSGIGLHQAEQGIKAQASFRLPAKMASGTRDEEAGRRKLEDARRRR